MAALTCPECKDPARVLYFFDNGLSSCYVCANEVRKRPREAYKADESFDSLRHYNESRKKRSRS
jgi:hypothetical protein